jgi:hypothetical protein
MELPPELCDKIMIMRYYLMSQDKKIYFKQIHNQLILLFDEAYDYHIDKYIGYESMIIALDDGGTYEFDESKIKEEEHKILYELYETKMLVTCIKAMMRNQLEYT